jgi:sporulation protein YlmC with PRC-barrel domain
MNTREVLGSTVRDRNGRAVGSVEEIVVDRLTGRVTFAVVSLAAAAGGGSEAALLPVPWSALTNSEDESLRLGVAARSVADAPTIASDELDDLERRDVSVEVFSHYGVQPPWESAGTD